MRLASTMLTLLTLAACATGHSEYTPPAQLKNFTSSKVIDKPKDQVWSEIIPRIGERFFVINNIDERSGFLNLSYSGDPEGYIDCGDVYTMVSNARGKREYRFKGAAKYAEYEAIGGNILWHGKRAMKLEGRINLIVQSLNAKQTKLTANTKYIVTKELNMMNHEGKSSNESESINFNGNESKKFSNIETTCLSTGNLEREILSIIE